VARAGVQRLLLVALLALHMIAHHFVVEGGLRDFDQVVDYVSNPAIFTSHPHLPRRRHPPRPARPARHPSRSVAVAGAVRLVNWLFAIIGVAAIIYGIWLEVVIIGYGA
jgi:hypothetical protein